MGCTLALGMAMVSTKTRFHTGRFDDAAARGRLHGGHQQSLHTVVADALASARQAARVDGRFCLQADLAARELPVQVLSPRCWPQTRQRRRRCAAGTQQASDQATRVGREQR